jgi:hypothetical protein
VWRGYSHPDEKDGAERIPANVSFHCTLRNPEPLQKHRTQDRGGIFACIPTFGFSIDGDRVYPLTSTMLVFQPGISITGTLFKKEYCLIKTTNYDPN